MSKGKNQEEAKPDSKSTGSPPPSAPLTPKRGAYPTPKEEIERATPYVPDSDKTGGKQQPEPDSPSEAESGGK